MNPSFGGGPSRPSWRGGKRKPLGDWETLAERLLDRYPFFEEHPFILGVLIVLPLWFVILWVLVYFL